MSNTLVGWVGGSRIFRNRVSKCNIQCQIKRNQIHHYQHIMMILKMLNNDLFFFIFFLVLISISTFCIYLQINIHYTN